MRILSVNRHRMMTDGRGVTTLIALAGCPLSCRYCINEEILKHGTVKEKSSEEMLSLILKDYCYFIATGGGITFGGGEPLLQAEEIEKLCLILPPGISVNIETSLNQPGSKMQVLIPYVNEWIIDIKTMNAGIYEDYTGRDPHMTEENLRHLAELGLQDKCRIRIPSIPGYTTEETLKHSEDAIRAIGFSNIDRFEYRVH